MVKKKKKMPAAFLKNIKKKGKSEPRKKGAKKEMPAFLKKKIKK